MSDKNKKFRSHCDIDVLLDKESDTVSVSVNYKPELFQRPLGFSRHRYSVTDIKEELERQGIFINENAAATVIPRSGRIDNTSAYAEKHSLSVTFKISTTKTSTKKTTKAATPPNPSPSSTKKTTKTTAKTANK